MRTVALLFVVFFAFAKANSQDITGTWKTIDDDTGIVKSHVTIYEKNGKYYGKVSKILDTSHGENPLCTECEGSKKDKPIQGMVILTGMEKKGASYKNGTITDPQNGKSYDCKIWLNEDNPNLLMVRGYILLLYRTQTWQRL